MLDSTPDPLRAAIDAGALAPEGPLVARLREEAGLSPAERAHVVEDAADLVRAIRSRGRPGLMEQVLAEYGLSTDEGVALMCLAEALLRVPDAPTIDALIEDKVAASDWGGTWASPRRASSTPRPGRSC
jgi:RHH-type proline utilization regulon transcriptional repressor/proline dehydrogenase/delta 1-pyrroline-5-carboxylate dehydrogenase